MHKCGLSDADTITFQLLFEVRYIESWGLIHFTNYVIKIRFICNCIIIKECYLVSY